MNFFGNFGTRIAHTKSKRYKRTENVKGGDHYETFYETKGCALQ